MYSQAVHIEENISLAPLTTLRVGGPARFLAQVATEAELLEAVGFAQSKELPVFVLGGGSNLLVADSGFGGVVLQMAIGGVTQFEDAGADGLTCRAAAAVDWDTFVLDACERGLTGLECLAGIPGLVGGTPVQNVGAYGQEVAETIVSVRALDLKTMQFISLRAAECGFGYRRSIFNSTERGRYVVTEVSFRLERVKDLAVELKYAELQRRFEGRVPNPIAVYHAVREIRHGKGMLLIEGEADGRSAGSFFKNPIVTGGDFVEVAVRAGLDADKIPHWNAGDGRVKLAAAWLLEQAGFHKGFAMGRAGISSRHTLAVINRGDATAEEIIALRNRIQEVVEERFGVRLEQEPVMVG